MSMIKETARSNDKGGAFAIGRDAGGFYVWTRRINYERGNYVTTWWPGEKRMTVAQIVADMNRRLGHPTFSVNGSGGVSMRTRRVREAA